MKPTDTLQIGFTGTQRGMTDAQYSRVKCILQNLHAFHAYHGDCIGADEEFHQIAIWQEHCRAVTIFPSNIKNKRAFCQPWGVGTVYFLCAPLERNGYIVSRGFDLLIATPKEEVPQTRSGTWATVRYARKIGHSIVVVNPDGTYTDENGAALLWLPKASQGVTK